MRSKWLMVALLGSLALNLALAGFLVGRLTVPGPVPAALDPSVGLFRVLRTLPETRRDALGPPLHEHFRTLRAELKRMRSAQQRINRALVAEPFDRAALRQALAEFRTALIDSQEHNHGVLVEMAAAMTPHERRLLRDAMIRGPGGHRGHRPPPDARGPAPASAAPGVSGPR